MNKESYEFLKDLANCLSPSGNEEEASVIWRKRTSAFCDTVTKDIHGNSIAELNAGKKVRVMLAGHIDEIGYMVKYIDKEGYIYFSLIGGIDLHLVPGQRVWINTQKGKILGVVGKKPIHLLEGDERKRVSKLEDLWIDIGVKSDKEAFKVVEIGDSVVPAVLFEKLNKNFIVSRGLDDKTGAYAISETLKLLEKNKFKVSVYGVATVQEEIGLRGATTSAFNLNPDVAIAIDVTFATDFPGMNKKKAGDISLGKGPVIARGPNINPKVFKLLKEVAERNKIPYQVQGIPRGTGTDANAIQLSRGGVATGLVSIPLRYMHTPVEVVHLEDLENTAKLLKYFIMKLDDKISFIP